MKKLEKKLNVKKKKEHIDTETKKFTIVLVNTIVSFVVGFFMYPYLLNEYGEEWAWFGTLSTLLFIAFYGIYLILTIE